MTTSVTLTTSWQKIADAGSILATFVLDGQALVHFAATTPSGDVGHAVEDGSALSVTIDQNTYAKLADSESTGSVVVTEQSGSMEFGTGLSLINVAPRITLVSK